ncbi:MAG: hypothetical protein NW201_08310 [Gemmatimonadales bacterium]|nr:hypothetical protein [Gemmatimonadales bacterium]
MTAPALLSIPGGSLVLPASGGLPHLAGLALVPATGLVLLASATALLLALARRDGRLALGAVATAGAWSAGYAALVVLGIVFWPRRALPRGRELALCGGIDCHLHVSALAQGDGTVRVRARSDARRASERLDAVRFRLVDAAGREHAPVAPPALEPLPAGDAREFVLRFPVPAEPGTRLQALWAPGVLDYLVVGPDNSLVARKTTLSL